MDRNSNKSIALLPIQPHFAKSIMAGEKKIEFRKIRFRNKITYIVVYASSPIKKILGYFEVSHIDEDSPKKLWARYNTIGGIFHKEFWSYYSSSNRGIAIGVGKISVLRNPLPLSTLGKSLPVPQNFMYLTESAFYKIRRYA